MKRTFVAEVPGNHFVRNFIFDQDSSVLYRYTLLHLFLAILVFQKLSRNAHSERGHLTRIEIECILLQWPITILPRLVLDRIRYPDP